MHTLVPAASGLQAPRHHSDQIAQPTQTGLDDLDQARHRHADSSACSLQRMTLDERAEALALFAHLRCELGR